jgi:hypothetical protein
MLRAFPKSAKTMGVPPVTAPFPKTAGAVWAVHVTPVGDVQRQFAVVEPPTRQKLFVVAVPLKAIWGAVVPTVAALVQVLVTTVE